MEFETIKRKSKKKIIIGVIVFCVIGVVITFATTRAKYRNTQSINIAKGTINYSREDFEIVAMYDEKDNELSTMPESEYKINEEKSYCNVNGEKDTNVRLYTNASGEHIMSKLKKGSKCYLYFDILDNTAPTISNVATSVTKTEISVTITASDDKGLSKYYYKIDSGSYVEKTINTHTFTGLAAGSTHTISVYVTDRANNQSTITTKTITTTPDGQTISSILAGLNKANRGSITSEITTTTTKLVYSAEDDNGTSYYYAGAATDNYVSFAGFYWRIVRFNGDGSLRLIYDGTTVHQNGESSTDRQIGKSTFNNYNSMNKYVGYMHDDDNIHSNTSSSAIKTMLDNWYTSNLASYASKIDVHAGFCNDRTPTSGTAIGTQSTTYAPYSRILKDSEYLYTPTPTFKCQNSSDLFTTSSTTKGNRALSYPIGLLTMDEATFAGAYQSTYNRTFYLYNGQQFWTMSPSVAVRANNFTISSTGNVTASDVTYTNGVRPVINLRSNTLFATGGIGTSSNPYVVI